MNGKSCSMSRWTTDIPWGLTMISGSCFCMKEPSKVHAGKPCPSSNSSTPTPDIGNLSFSRHVKMPLWEGAAPQSNIIDSTFDLPALRPRKQMVTNGKPLLQVPQTPELPALQSLKPNQQEFGNTLSPCTGEGKIPFPIAISNSISSPMSHTQAILVSVDGIQSFLYHSSTTKKGIQNVLLFSTKGIHCFIIPRGLVLHNSCSESLNCPQILYKQCSLTLFC